MFFFTEGVVGIAARWRAADFPLVYITSAVMAMLEKRPEL